MIWISLKENEMKKIRSTKHTWYDCLINYIPEPIVSGSKDKALSLFNTNTPKQTKRARERRETNQTKNNLKKTKLIALEKKKTKEKNVNSITKDRTIRDILTLHETKEEKRKKERN